MPPETYVSKDEFEGRKSLEDERFKRDNDRLQSMESLMRAISENNIRMAQVLEQLKNNQEDHTERLDALEQKPAKRWESVVGSVVAAMVAAACAYFIGKG